MNNEKRLTPTPQRREFDFIFENAHEKDDADDAIEYAMQAAWNAAVKAERDRLRGIVEEQIALSNEFKDDFAEGWTSAGRWMIEQLKD